MVNKKCKILNSNVSEIMNQLKKYNILDKFNSKELEKWVLKLNRLEMNNLLSLNVEPECIKFSSELLIDRNLLNTLDYNERIAALVSIQNAEGWYHLFDRMLNPEFLNSAKFYQDIETLKRAECAQTPLWIIGDPVFIHSPYHDEDFELLVTAKDKSEKDFDFVVWDTIATIASNRVSIYSEYHRQDLQTIVKYGSKSLQMSHSYPESTIHYLATSPVSLKDRYHLENMEILAQNYEIGNFLYVVMTDSRVIKRKNYRTIIEEMVANKNDICYVFLVCYYAVGEKAIKAQNRCLHQYFYEENYHNLEELLKQVEDQLYIRGKNVRDVEYKEVIRYEIECNENKDNNQSLSVRNSVRRLFKKK